MTTVSLCSIIIFYNFCELRLFKLEIKYFTEFTNTLLTSPKTQQYPAE